MPKKLVIFDFDGVLVDTLLVCYEFNAETNPGLDIEEYKDFFFGNIYYAKRKDGSPRNRHPHIWEVYAEKTRNMTIPHILKETLHKLAQKYTLAIVSSTHGDSIHHIVEKEGCDVFSDILGGDFHPSKVKKINDLLEKYTMSPDNTVFITDTVGDVLEADECNVRSIAVLWGFHDEKRFLKCHPFKKVAHPEDLLGTIEGVLQ